MKKVLVLIFGCILSCLIIGCSGNNTTSNNKQAKKLTEEEFLQMYSDVEKFRGDNVEFFARIFITPEKDDKATYFQCFAKNDNNKNTMVCIKDPKLDVKEGDIVHVVGTVKKKFEGTNGFGAKIGAPMILASKVEKTDFATAFAKAIKTINVNKEINQNGYVMKLNKVEISKEETRAYVTINNKSQNNISFYHFNSKLVQGNKQIKTKDNFDAKYPEIKDELLPGVKEEGIVLFDKVDVNCGNLKLYLEGSTDNYDMQLKPFEYDINLK